MKQVENTEELLSLTKLEDISFLELSGRAKQDATDNSDSEENTPVDVPMRVQTRVGEEAFDVRLAVDLDLPSAAITVDVAAKYSLSEPSSIPEPVLKDFVERVAMGHLYPYAREGVAEIAAKLRIPAPVLPMIILGTGSLEPRQLDPATDLD